MTIRRITTERQIMKYHDDGISARERVLIRRLQHVGEVVVKHAKELPSPPPSMRGKPHQPNYIDDTVNLRSSIGYVVVRDGAILSSYGFDAANGGTEGASRGRSFAQEVVSRHFMRGLALIVVAGMNYAGEVEARGYDVLTSSELLAIRITPGQLQKLGFEKL